VRSFDRRRSPKTVVPTLFDFFQDDTTQVKPTPITTIITIVVMHNNFVGLQHQQQRQQHFLINPSPKTPMTIMKKVVRIDTNLDRCVQHRRSQLQRGVWRDDSGPRWWRGTRSTSHCAPLLWWLCFSLLQQVVVVQFVYGFSVGSSHNSYEKSSTVYDR